MKFPMNSIIVALLLSGSSRWLQVLPRGCCRRWRPTRCRIDCRQRHHPIRQMPNSTINPVPCAGSGPDFGSGCAAKSLRAEQSRILDQCQSDQLRQGLALSTSARGAVIRLSPHAGTAGTLDPATLGVRAGGRIYTSADALRSTADEESLRAAGMQVPQGSVVVRLADSIDAGVIELIAATAQGDYLVHVFEPSSAVVLHIQADRDTVLSGQTLAFRARVEGGARLDRLAGLLSSPEGYSQDVSFVRKPDGSFVARVRPDPAHAGGYGLWEIHAYGQASNGRISVARDARNAFAVSVPSARLAGSIERLALSASDTDLNLRVGIEVAAASRYQLAGVLYGTRSDGSLAPAVVAHSAAWLEPGSAAIDLQFDSAALRQANVVAPFELRDLRLINQADMSLIERRERAASLR